MSNCIFCDQDNPPGLTQCQLCNAPLPDSETAILPEDVFYQHLKRLLGEHQRIQAVAAYRRRMGVDLTAAVEAIDALERDQQFNVNSSDADLEWEIIGYLERCEKIAAIKLYRDKTNVGLKEAKDAVEAIELRMGLAPVAERRGCFGVMFLLCSLLTSICLTFLLAAEPPPQITAATKEETGVLTHEVRSEYQRGTTKLRVLLPDPLEPNRKYPVIYVLPVEAGDENRYGNGLNEIVQKGLHRQYPIIFVAPTFSHLPWYADHPTDATIRQESYLLQVVLPYIGEHYPTLKEPSGRWLLGFSKSGWGAFSLLLRNPKVFGRASAWDAPLMMADPSRYGMSQILETQANFEKYQLTRLLESRATELQGDPRLIILGYDNFRTHHQQARELLTKLQIPHIYRDGPQRKHVWGSGWVEESVGLLIKPEVPQ
ncbi:MAG: hypothetical protein JWN70_2617 [Planctomycetaceae bacterium]|nr:hypothetical protein [Planctomycetaceae bacterium]